MSPMGTMFHTLWKQTRRDCSLRNNRHVVASWFTRSASRRGKSDDGPPMNHPCASRPSGPFHTSLPTPADASLHGESRTPPRSTSLEAVLLATDWMPMLSPSARDCVIADSFDRIYAPKEVVSRCGEAAAHWIGVVDGLLKVSTVTTSGRTVMFTAVPSGSWVGEGSVIKREPRRYDLVAMRSTRVIHVPRATFMRVLETSIEFSRFVIDHLNERAGQFLAMHEGTRISDPAGRMASAICGLFNAVLYPKAGPRLNMSQEEIGELAGLSRPTTNMAISKLKKLRLVCPEYGGLLVLDINRLREFAYAAEVTDDRPG